jgi:hypothetical protein
VTAPTSRCAAIFSFEFTGLIAPSAYARAGEPPLLQQV